MWLWSLPEGAVYHCLTFLPLEPGRSTWTTCPVGPEPRPSGSVPAGDGAITTAGVRTQSGYSVAVSGQTAVELWLSRYQICRGRGPSQTTPHTHTHTFTTHTQPHIGTPHRQTIDTNHIWHTPHTQTICIHTPQTPSPSFPPLCASPPLPLSPFPLSFLSSLLSLSPLSVTLSPCLPLSPSRSVSLSLSYASSLSPCLHLSPPSLSPPLSIPVTTSRWDRQWCWLFVTVHPNFFMFCRRTWRAIYGI